MTSYRNTALNDFNTAAGANAIFRIVAGNQPTDASAAVTAGNTICASLTMASTNAFGSASAGVLTANTITADATAIGGTAVWFTIQASGSTIGSARLADGSVGTSGADLNLNTTAIATNAQVSVTSLTITFSA